jgi:hypothetical protein
MNLKIALNSQSSYLILLSAGITGMHHHTQLPSLFQLQIL